MAAFCDLNVLYDKAHDGPSGLEKKVEMALKLGYDIIAINNFQEELKSKKKRKGNDSEQVSVEDATHLKLSDAVFSNICLKNNKSVSVCRQYTRFTLRVTDAGQVHMLSRMKAVQSYDIIAAQPTTEKLFQILCGLDCIDIITLDMTEKLPFKIKRQSLGLAKQHGIYFEIVYCPAIRDSTHRRYTLSNAIALQNFIRGNKKNIIISSKCEKPIEIRGPSDVANLALLFGLTQEQANAAVSTNCRAVIKHAETRKTSKGAISVTQKEPSSQNKCSPGEGIKDQNSDQIHKMEIKLESSALDNVTEQAGEEPCLKKVKVEEPS